MHIHSSTCHIIRKKAVSQSHKITKYRTVLNLAEFKGKIKQIWTFKADNINHCSVRKWPNVAKSLFACKVNLHWNCELINFVYVTAGRQHYCALLRRKYSKAFLSRIVIVINVLMSIDKRGLLYFYSLLSR